MTRRFKFNTVGLFTRDNRATVDFYTKTFGFATDWDGVQPNVEMVLGDMRIILFLHLPMWTRNTGMRWTTAPSPCFLPPPSLGGSALAMLPILTTT